MKIQMTVTLQSNEAYRAILAILYAERKRLTDHCDHARAHGDLYMADTLPALDSLIDGMQYGAMLEGPPPKSDNETDAMAALRARVLNTDD